MDNITKENLDNIDAATLQRVIKVLTKQKIEKPRVMRVLPNIPCRECRLQKRLPCERPCMKHGCVQFRLKQRNAEMELKRAELRAHAATPTW